MDLPDALLIALLGAEVAAVVLAVRLGCSSAAPMSAARRNPSREHESGGETGALATSPEHDGQGRNARSDRLVSGQAPADWPGERLLAAAAIRARKVAASTAAPLVALLSFALADELAQAALHALLDGAPRPLAGWARLGWHVSIALSLGWPAALAATAMVDKSASARRDGCGQSRVNRRLDPLLGAYLGTLAGLAIVYPPSRAGLRWTLLAWELACVAVAWWGIARRWRATWGPVERCFVVLVACETMVVIVGPFASDPFLRWWIARVFYLGAWGLACGVLARVQTANKGI